jgi:hypothetical protein
MIKEWAQVLIDSLQFLLLLLLIMALWSMASEATIHSRDALALLGIGGAWCVLAALRRRMKG